MYKIAVLRGDGIGPEIVDESLKVLDFIADKYQLDFDISFGHFGGEGIDKEGCPFPETTKRIIDQADAVLLGAVGGPKWNDAPKRPEAGLLELRQYIKSYCNVRPIIGFEPLLDMSPVKLDGPVDICFIRELTGGIYFGERGFNEDEAFDVEKYSKSEVQRISKKAFEYSKNRRGKVTSVDKSNVLSSSKLWRQTVKEISKAYDSELNHMYVDNAAMQLILNPYQFDVVLTNNIFGDILSDEASVLAGSIGVLPSASIGDGIGLFEPIHGSAPDIAGEDIANPIGMIMSLAMMLDYLGYKAIYNDIYEAINNTLKEGYGTIDLKLDRHITTSEWTNRLIKTLGI